MIEINHFRNSFVEVAIDNKKMWCDPWLSDANNGDWLRADISYREFCNRYGYPDIIYISHIHNDHFDIQFLRYLSNKKNFRVVIGDQYESLKIVIRRIIGEGIVTPEKIVTLDFYQPTKVDAYTITLLPDNKQSEESSQDNYPLDTSIIIEVENLQIYNQTDNIVSIDTLNEYKVKYQQACNKKFEPDLSFLPYCGASAYPQSFIGIDRLEERKHLIEKLFKERFTDIAINIGSGYFFPSGGTYSLRDRTLDPFKIVPTSIELTKLLESSDDCLKDLQ